MRNTGVATRIGLGFRSEMLDWEPAAIKADFFEVAPENWIRRDQATKDLRVAVRKDRSQQRVGRELQLGHRP